MGVTTAIYNNFGKYVKNISQYGSDLRDDIKQIYTLMAELNDSSEWKGSLYDEVVETFNKVLDGDGSAAGGLNEAIEGIGFKIPSGLATIAGQYGNWDAGNDINFTVDEAKKVTKLNKSGLDGLKFDKDQLSQKAETMKKLFSQAEDCVKNAKQEWESMESNEDWSGEEYDKVTQDKVSPYFKSVQSYISEMSKSLNDALSQILENWKTTTGNVTSVFE